MSFANSVFDPLLKQFCESTNSVGISESFSTIFLPHTMKGYENSARKIFYFGRDTYGWIPTGRLMKCFSENNLTSYIEQTSEWVNDYGFLEYNKNRASGFWTLAMRLHLRLKGYSKNLKIGENLPSEYYSLIDDFGWGNTNSIEVPASLVNQGIWETLDKNKYWQIKEKSKIFDRLSHTINSYKPDLVFIFNWDCDEHLFLSALDYTEERHSRVGNHFLTYYLPDTNTRVVWTVHPTAARWLGYGVDIMIDEIVDFLSNDVQSAAHNLIS